MAKKSKEMHTAVAELMIQTKVDSYLKCKWNALREVKVEDEHKLVKDSALATASTRGQSGQSTGNNLKKSINASSCPKHRQSSRTDSFTPKCQEVVQ